MTDYKRKKKVEEVTYQAGELLLQQAFILLDRLKLFLFALHVNTQLTDLSPTHRIEHTTYTHEPLSKAINYASSQWLSQSTHKDDRCLFT